MSTATIKTDKGDMTVEFYDAEAPGTVANFRKLAAQGFYDGLAFHRVIPNFMIQGGCPNTRKGATGQPGTGRPDGPGVRAEFTDTPHTRGVLSMARSRDPNSAGSQFFVVHAEHAPHLDDDLIEKRESLSITLRLAPGSPPECLLGDDIPSSQPTLSAVSASLATVPADNCFVR